MVDRLDVDFAFAACREDGEWDVQEIADPALQSVETLASGLRRFPSDSGAIAMIGFDEDVFLIVRELGPQGRILLSDITAADESDMARTEVETLNLPLPAEDEDSAPDGAPAHPGDP